MLGVHKVSKIVGTTSEFLVPEGRH